MDVITAECNAREFVRQVYAGNHLLTVKELETFALEGPERYRADPTMSDQEIEASCAFCAAVLDGIDSHRDLIAERHAEGLD